MKPCEITGHEDSRHRLDDILESEQLSSHRDLGHSRSVHICYFVVE